MKKTKPRTLAIIPARGKSKCLPRKNVKLLAGKPLIVYSIEAAKQSKYIDKVIVSTDDKEIAEIAKTHGIEVIDRPTELARDDSPVIDAVFHALGSLKSSYIPDVIVLLQPTSPLRNSQDVDNAIELFLKKECESVVGVIEDISPYWSFKMENSYLKPIFGKKYLKKRRQDLPKLYLPNGAIFISTPSMLKKYRSFYCKKTIPYVMPMERSIDIDTDIDFILAEIMIEKTKKLRKE